MRMEMESIDRKIDDLYEQAKEKAGDREFEDIYREIDTLRIKKVNLSQRIRSVVSSGGNDEFGVDANSFVIGRRT